MGELSTETSRIETVVGRYGVASIFATILFWRNLLLTTCDSAIDLSRAIVLVGIVPIAFAGVMCGCYIIPDFRSNPGSFGIQRIAGINSYTLNHRRDDVYQLILKLLREKPI